MSRIIFSVYIDPNEIYNGDPLDFKSAQLSKHLKALKHKQEEYAKICDADYRIYELDDAYRLFLDRLDHLEVFETQYQCIQPVSYTHLTLPTIYSV